MVNKKEFITKMVETNETLLTKKAAGEALDCVLHTLATVLEEGESVKFTGFGNFEIVEKEAREARNPRTGEAVSVAAHNVVKFRPSSVLKEAVK